MKKLFALIVSLFVSTSAFAANVPNIEAYAHPTLFGDQVQQYVQGDNSLYVIGEKRLDSKNTVTVTGKENVLVSSFVKDVLSLIKETSNSKTFNSRMPILRSEMAVVLAEGLSIKKVKVKYAYKDIEQGYWAKTWIDKVLSEGVMIGYPDRKFRPDQPITKAEVFATIAQLINVPTDKSKTLPEFKGYEMKNIPAWAIAPAKEVMASNLLNEIPEPEKVAKAKYLSKEQVAYLVGVLRDSYIFDSKFACKKYAPTYLTVKLDERIDARHSNIGDTFTTTTTQEAKVLDKTFAAGSKVKGEVVEISRPGLKNPGYVKVKFTQIKNGDCVVDFPNNISDVKSTKTNNTNVIARVVAAPFSATARVAGVVGRTGAAGVNVIANDTERYGDNWSNTFANVFSLKPMAGIKNVGQSFVTIGSGIYDLAKLAVSGTFGVVYEFTDEVKYLILPSTSNNASLNAGEELVIIY